MRQHPAHHYRLCRACGTGQLTPLPTRPEQLYTRDYFVQGGEIAGYVDYEADERWHRLTARQRLRRLESARSTHPGILEPGTLADVGAATGFFLDVAREAGWQATGVETSAWAAQRARDKGHPVVGELCQVAGPLDAVCFFQVLEHLADPRLALQQAAERLVEGGTVICETWDVGSRTARWAGSRWQQLSPPSVLWLFTRAGMARMACDAGLELVAWRPTPKLVSLSTVLGQQVGASNHGLAARLLRGVGRFAAAPYPLDDLVTAVLQKS
ncbi:class I SAM-dependent methyltransferase [Luteococcus peritonei]